MSDSPPLAGETAAHVVRALLDYRTVWTTHDVVSMARLPAVVVQPVISRLEAESLVTRRTTAAVAVPDWLNLLHAWCQDYGFSTHNTISRWATRHATREVLDRISGSSLEHAVTGTHAASVWASDTPAGPLAVYTPDAHLAATVWELEPAPAGDIILAEPSIDVVYRRLRKLPTGLHLAAPAQVLADLLTGAAPTLAASYPLTTWMEADEGTWRY